MGKKPKPQKDYDYVIFTDGGCIINPGGAGAYGIVVTDNATGEVTEYSKAFASTTNNRMEVLAVITALEMMKPGESALIHSDSQYTVNTAEGIWKGNKNPDLWKRYRNAKQGKTVDYVWVRGHNGNRLNERCDELCTIAMQTGPYDQDTGYTGKKKAAPEYSYVSPKKKYTPKKTKEEREPAIFTEIEIPDGMDAAPEKMSVEAYSRKYNCHASCAAAICAFAEEPHHNFNSYASLRTGGLDNWSVLTSEELKKYLGKDVWIALKANLHGKDLLSAARWVCRGLSVKDAIMKALVDSEINDSRR